MSLAPELKVVTEDPQTVAPNETAGLDAEKKKKYLYSALAGVAFVILFLSFFWFYYNSRHISTDNAYVDTDLYPVHCRIMGYVKEVLVTEGQPVTKGQPLVVFDDTDINVELSFKQAKFKKAEADFGRAEKLVKASAISVSDFEGAKTLYSIAKADLEGSLLKLQYTNVLAPIDGTIGKKTVEIGQFVQPGQNLMVVVPTNKFWIKANYKETQLEKVKPGMSVEIKIDAFPGKTWNGKVETIFPSSGAKFSVLPPENASGNFTKIVQRIPLKISIDLDNEVQLRNGMSAQTTIILK